MHLEALELELAHAVDMASCYNTSIEVWAFAVHHFRLLERA
jgi:hypothetical protein